MESLVCRSSTLLFKNVQILRQISTCSCLMAGEKVRESRGQARDGIAYGPLTDKPDWSYADGRPAPETKRRKMRRIKSLFVAETIKTYLEEMDNAARVSETEEETDDTIIEDKKL